MDWKVASLVLLALLAALSPVPGAKETARITGVIGPGEVRAGPASSIVVEDIVVSGVTRVYLQGAQSVTLSGALELRRGSSLHLLIRGAGEVRITNLTVSSSEPWTGLLVLEVHQCGKLVVDGLIAPNATFVLSAAGCASISASRLWDPLQSSSLSIAGAAIVSIDRAALGNAEITGTGAAAISSARLTSLWLEAFASARLHGVETLGKLTVRGVPPLGPSVEIEGVEASNITIEGAGYAVARGIHASRISFSGNGLAAWGLTAAEASVEARRLALTGAVLGRLWTSAGDVLLYNVSIDSSRAGDRSPALTVWSPRANITLYRAGLSSDRSAIFLGAPALGENESLSLEYDIRVLESALTARSSYAILALENTARLHLLVALSRVEGQGLVAAGNASGHVVVAGSTVRALPTGEVVPTGALVGVARGRVVIAASSVHLETPYITLPAREGTIQLVLARNNISAPPRVADTMATMIPGGVNLSLCLDPGHECSCGNAYSTSFSAVGTPVIYGVTDSYQATPGIEPDCPAEPLTACAAMDFRYGNLTRLNATGLPALLVYTLPASSTVLIGGLPPNGAVAEHNSTLGSLVRVPVEEAPDRAYRAFNVTVTTQGGAKASVTAMLLGVPTSVEAFTPVNVTPYPAPERVNPAEGRGETTANVLVLSVAGTVQAAPGPGPVIVLGPQYGAEPLCYALLGPAPVPSGAVACEGTPSLPEPRAPWEWYALAATSQAVYDTAWGILLAVPGRAGLEGAPAGTSNNTSIAGLAVAASTLALALAVWRAVRQG